MQCLLREWINKTHCTPLQMVQTKMLKSTMAYWGPCMQSTSVAAWQAHAMVLSWPIFPT